MWVVDVSIGVRTRCFVFWSQVFAFAEFVVGLCWYELLGAMRCCAVVCLCKARTRRQRANGRSARARARTTRFGAKHTWKRKRGGATKSERDAHSMHAVAGTAAAPNAATVCNLLRVGLYTTCAAVSTRAICILYSSQFDRLHTCEERNGATHKATNGISYKLLSLWRECDARTSARLKIKSLSCSRMCAYCQRYALQSCHRRR